MKESLVINSPYKRPAEHWKFDGPEQPPTLTQGRRPAGYLIFDPRAKLHQDEGTFIELPLVNRIRQRVDKWRDDGYQGITGVTKALLEHWADGNQRENRFFFCQIEAIETLIWLVEAPPAERVGIDIPNDGGEFRRLCSKLATGTGKTVVMAMLIAWQAINRATYPNDKRFSKNVFIVAPNLTVRERLAVLRPSNEPNYYDEFNVVPLSLREKLNQAKVLIRNWHALQWDSEEKIKNKKSVDKRGPKSDAAYAREVLGDMASARKLIVINDEAHHAWRVPANSNVKRIKKEEKEAKEEATIWVGGLDRLHKTQVILNCFDFSATPFVPSSNIASEQSLFSWIVSDFGLNDAIESGLVKTPKMVVRDDAPPDAKTNKSRLYHIYNDKDVKDDLNRRAKPYEPLPKLVVNAYTLLGKDWCETKKAWKESQVPPVMVTVTNRTETAARIEHTFKNKDIVGIEPICDPDGILHIDSAVLKKAEEMEPEPAEADKEDNRQKAKPTAKGRTEYLRQQVNTVGKIGAPGEKIQNIISVGMLSEGWDAHTVTHIMGLRAFTSQLLCEQVIGRGLRRASYDINKDTGLFESEYVNVFGVPFSFLPSEGGDGSGISEKKITVMPLKEKDRFAIKWPNVDRIDRTYKYKLSVDWNKVERLILDTSQTIKIAEMAPTMDGKPDVSQIQDIDLDELMQRIRKQTLIFKAACSAYKKIQLDCKISKHILVAELVRLAEQFIDSDRIKVTPKLYDKDEQKRKLIIALNMPTVMRHFAQAIKPNSTEKLALVLNSNHPICATGDMRPWRTGRPCKITKKKHINYCVCDSTWEASCAFQLDRHAEIDAWVKNDHLGFAVRYVYQAVVRKYYPDFIIRWKSGLHLVLEVKGQKAEHNDAKHDAMKEWIQAVNEDGRFGQWAFDIANKPSEIPDILAKYANMNQLEQVVC